MGGCYSSSSEKYIIKKEHSAVGQLHSYKREQFPPIIIYNSAVLYTVLWLSHAEHLPIYFKTRYIELYLRVD